MSNETYTSSTRIFKELLDEIGKVIVGQHEAVEQMMIAILCNSHALVESNPGLAKTLTISTISKALDLKFNRIQCTPDLMPSDITGTYIIEDIGGKKQFRFEPGPVFANIVLADEINRASPKTQSALLEAMQEKQVTIGNESYKLEQPFMVLATQNPIEQEGTYPLPEAQVDRFMLKVIISYPDRDEEKLIMRENLGQVFPVAKKVIKPGDILKARSLVKEVYMDEKIEKYILDIVFSTRYPDQYNLEKYKNMIQYGGSPRASIYLALGAKAYAFIKRRGYVIPEDVRALCHDVLRHRIGLTYEAEAENITTDNIITDILNTIEVP
jgi:MoxR-like ATPase